LTSIPSRLTRTKRPTSSATWKRNTGKTPKTSAGTRPTRLTEWEEARRAYAGALAYTAYSSIWEQTKQELIEAVEQFESDATDFGCSEPVISLSTSCLHGWAAHNREDADGTMYFESRQLDGCNGLARQAQAFGFPFVLRLPRRTRKARKPTRCELRRALPRPSDRAPSNAVAQKEGQTP